LSDDPTSLSEQDSSAGQFRIALVIEYDGSSFSGWQRQSAAGVECSSTVATVQQEVERALSRVAAHSVSVTCAGRTDAGVHATCQVVHFDCKQNRGEKAWTRGVNSLLPRSVRVLWAREVGEEFNARFTAEARRYNYVIYTRNQASAILDGRVTHVPFKLDVEAMNSAAQALVGEQDFTSFRAAGCQSSTPYRNVHKVRVSEHCGFVLVDIEANAFLQHMVRNIVGSLLVIGRGLKPVTWIRELLELRNRCEAAMTAPPHGLYLVQVMYPLAYGLPGGLVTPPFIALDSQSSESISTLQD
jgi:tRNA pseudouridine38-40 synthase